MELFVAYYSGAKYEMEAFKLRVIGPYWYVYLITLLCSIAPILLFFQKFRNSLKSVIVISLMGMLAPWFERFIMIVTPYF